MPIKKTDLKAVAIVVTGVLIAGFVMSYFRDLGPMAVARSGYN